jgi:hypothetical protein
LHHKFDSIHNTSFLCIKKLIRFTTQVSFESPGKIRKKWMNQQHAMAASHVGSRRLRAGGRQPRPRPGAATALGLR